MIGLGILAFVVVACVVALVVRGRRPEGGGANGDTITVRVPRERRSGPGWLRGSRGSM